MNNEKKPVSGRIPRRLPTVLTMFLVLFGILTQVSFGSQYYKYTSEAVEAIEMVEAATDVEIPEVSVETEAVTEPVTSETTLPLETSVDVTEPPTEPIWTGPEDPSPDDNLGLLACVIYQEAGGDDVCDDCRRRVADVVLNRMASSRFPNTIHGVLTQESQYGCYYWTGVVWPDRARKDSASEKAAVERAYRIAEEVLHGKHSELFGKGYIWQAGFVQGYDNIYCCGHYFGK